MDPKETKDSAAPHCFAEEVDGTDRPTRPAASLDRADGLRADLAASGDWQESHSVAERFSTLTETVPAVIFIHRNGRFVYINSAAEEILGYSRQEWVEMNFWEVVHPDCRQWVQERGLKRQQGEEVPTRYVLKAITKSGEARWLDCTAAKIDYEGQAAVLGCAFDVTERTRAEQRLGVQYAVTQILTESMTLQEAAPKLLGAVGEGLGWQRGNLWNLNPDATALHCLATWHAPADPFGRPELAYRPRRFLPGIGLPGRVWASGRAAWILAVRVGLETNFPPAQAAREDGLRSAVGFPILFQDRVVGVIEFFSREVREPDEELRKMMAAVGRQIGQFIERKRTEGALQESEERFALFMRHLPGAAWMKDMQGRYVYANETAEKIFHKPLEALRGKTDEEVFPLPTAVEFRENDRLAITSGRSIQTIEVLPQEDGPHYSSVCKFPIFGRDGKPVWVGGLALDITERLKTEKCKTAFSNLSYYLSGASTAQEAARIIVGVASDLLGWDACYFHLSSPTQDQLIPVLTIDTINGQRVDVPPASFNPEPSPMMRWVAEHGGQLINRGAPDSPPVELTRFGNTTRPSASMLYVPIRSGTEVIGILSIQSYTPYAYGPEDLETLQALAQHCGEALERINLAKEVLAVSEREQHRIGKDLHDGLGQLLTGVGFLARALEAKLAQQSVPEAAEANQIGQLAAQALAQTRMLAQGLFPVELEDRGLGPALQQLAVNVEKLFRVSCTVQSTSSFRFPNKTVEEHLYRIVQEATNNAIKHGRATRLQIALEETVDRIVLTVQDNGVGFRESENARQGMGVRIMQYRARSIGAELAARPQEGGGVVVTCALPKQPVTTQERKHGTTEGNTPDRTQSADSTGGRPRDGAIRSHPAH